MTSEQLEWLKTALNLMFLFTNMAATLREAITAAMKKGPGDDPFQTCHENQF